MFSTVDSPAARFFRVYLVSGTERRSVPIPDSLGSEARQVRTLPTSSKLEQLAREIASGSWVPYEASSAVEHYHKLLAQEQAFPAGVPGYARNAGGAVIQLPSNGTDAALAKNRMLRMQNQGEPKPSPGTAFEFQQARVELWKYRFDPQSAQLQAFQLTNATVVRLSK